MLVSLGISSMRAEHLRERDIESLRRHIYREQRFDAALESGETYKPRALDRHMTEADIRRKAEEARFALRYSPNRLPIFLGFSFVYLVFVGGSITYVHLKWDLNAEEEDPLSHYRAGRPGRRR